MWWLLLGWIGCETAKGGPASPPTLSCWDDLAPGEVQPFAAGFEGGTEGLAFVDGRLFVGTDTAVWELDPDGAPTLFWENDHVLGLAADGDALLVADPGVFSMGGDEDGQIWRVTLDGVATLVSEGWSNPNFLHRTPWGTVLMADDTVDVVVEIGPDGAGAEWLAVPSPNGLVLSEAGDSVVVASTFVPDASVWRASVVDGVAGPAELLGSTSAGGANDGAAAGPDGDVWVAANLAGEIWRFSQDDPELVVSGLDSPASLSFGQGAGFDPCSLYVTSLFGGEVVRVVIGPEAG